MVPLIFKRTFRNWSIKAKLTVVISVTCTFALIAASIILFHFQESTYRKSFANDSQTFAEVIAENAYLSLCFNDADKANTILETLRAKPLILEAALFNMKGELFAYYDYNQPATEINTADQQSLIPSHIIRTITPARPENRSQFVDSYLIQTQRIEREGELVGMLYLRSDYGQAWGKLLISYLGNSLVYIIVALLLAIVMSGGLQKIISGPILSLKSTAQAVVVNRDYGARAEKYSNDEVGWLADEFNRMMAEIQDQDRALQQARENLEDQVMVLQREIRERREAQEKLRRSEERFNLALRGTNDGIWDWNMLTNEVYYSDRFQELLGYAEAEFFTKFSAFKSALHPSDREYVMDQLEGHLQARHPFDVECRLCLKGGDYHWFRTRGQAVWDESGKAVRMAGSIGDINARKIAENELRKMHEQLLETSRMAGKAEVATSVLHNVGNVLNSVNVSSHLIHERVEGSRLANLRKAAELLQAQGDNLPAFFTNDPRGQRFVGYLTGLADYYEQDRIDQLEELKRLLKNVEHIKEIVSMQQNYARVSGVKELFNVDELVEDALALNADSLNRRKINVVRDFATLPQLHADRHKVIQIMVNLVRNACHALEEVAPGDRSLVVRTSMNGNQRVRIAVQDNGTGISPENLDRVFSLGFTTKRDGHGFGLHSGAVAAQEMKGRLTAQSEGLGKGATFCLEIPFQPPTQSKN